ncbi:MAG TPA: ETC complex I subunit [Sphingomonas sp.]|jgi:hypothetical protein|nr:ETC complex I subunit [Sphingomonas sp.]
MPTARIFQRPKNAMQSGKYRTGHWQLEFEAAEAMHADPLTGWAGSGDTRDQIRLSFPTREAAVAYCESQGFDFVVVPAPEAKLKLQAYSDNFR